MLSRPLHGESIVEQFRLALTRESHRIGLRAVGRDVDAFLRVNGIHPRPGSLRDVGRALSLSPEGVRRICTGLAKKGVLQSLQCDSSHEALRRQIRVAADLFASGVPASEAQLAPSLRQSGLLADNERPLAVWRAAQVLGLASNVKVVSWGPAVAFEQAGAPSNYRSVVLLARKIAAASGAVCATALVERLSATGVPSADALEVETMLEVEGVHVGDTVEAVGGHPYVRRWFHFPKTENLAVARAVAMVRAMGHISLAALFGADGRRVHPRNSRSAYLIPVPPQIIGEVLRTHGMHVQGDRVALVAPYNGAERHASEPRSRAARMPSRTHLSENKRKMLQAMRRMIARQKARGSNSIDVPRKDFIAHCMQRGLNRTTVLIYLYRSGLFECKGGTCRLAGDAGAT